MSRLIDKVLVPIMAKYKFRPLLNALNKKREKYSVPPATLPLGDFSTVLGLANTFVGFEAASPLQPNVRMIGPIRIESPHKLSSEIDSFLKEHPRTLYIAFGSRVILSEFDIENLALGSLVAMKEGSIDGVIWGLGSTLKDDFPEKIYANHTELTIDYLFRNNHPHIRLLPWAPQDAILNHKNTKLFIFHGGLDSAFEAIFSATPVLCMPFFSDQPRNARKLEDAGIGKYIDRITATPNSIATQIKSIVEDKNGNFATNLKRMQTLAQIGSRRKELGADAIEEYAYAARICRPIQKHIYGQVPCEAKHLIPVSKYMSYIRSNLLDVYFVTGAGLALFIYLVAILAWKLLTYLFKRSQVISKKKKLQ
ncbi:hypothetical protein L0F63_000595 [Massospora cicadina]|nr:hypothetical protein L0F63_000595 [Massospora cicadina]